MKMYFYLSVTALLFAFGCNRGSGVSSDEAKDAVEVYLEDFPLFETGYVSLSKLKLSEQRDSVLINDIESLRKEGFINLVTDNKKKKWLSKDSVWIVSPVLTQKAVPYVVEQMPSKAEVKTVEYVIDDDAEVVFDRKAEKSATCTVVLHKVKTPFYAFGKDAMPNSSFITKKYKLRYHEESGWRVVGDK